MALFQLYIHWDISPILFQIPGTPIEFRWYGFMWILGLILSRQVGLYIFLKDNRYTENLHSLFLWIVIPAFIGARIAHFLFYDLEALTSDPLQVILPPFHGMSSHGGIAGILAGVYAWCRLNKANYLFVLDRLCIVSCIPAACIRVGNLINSEIIGVPTTLPWAFVFEKVDSLPRHPAQLYEALFYAALFFLLFYIWRKYSETVGTGTILGIMLTMLWTFRFFIEMVKVNQSPFENSLLFNMGQILSIPFILLGCYLIFFRMLKKS